MTDTAAVRLARLLIADDQPDILEALQLLLKGEGYQRRDGTCRRPACCLAVQTHDFDAALIDLNYARDTTSGDEGLDLLGRIRAADPTLPVSVMTAWGSVDGAVEAMRRGAYDYVEKPWDNDGSCSPSGAKWRWDARCARGRQLQTEIDTLRSTPGRPLLIAESPRMRPVLDLMARIAPVRRQRADHRRARDRQGARRPVAARGVAARQPPLHRRQPRRTVRRAVRERVVRPRARRVHRCQDRPRRPLRAGRWRLAVPRRDRQHLAVSAGQAAARAADAGGRAGRDPRGPSASMCASSPRPTPICATKCWAAASAKTCSSASTRSRSRSLRCVTGARTSCPWLAISSSDMRSATAAAVSRSMPVPRKPCSPTAGPATCGSSTTRSSAACCWRRARRCARATSGLRPPGPPARLEDLTLAEAERAIIERALSRFGGNVSQAAKALGLEPKRALPPLGKQWTVRARPRHRVRHPGRTQPPRAAPCALDEGIAARRVWCQWCATSAGCWPGAPSRSARSGLLPCSCRASGLTPTLALGGADRARRVLDRRRARASRWPSCVRCGRWPT